MGKTKSPSHILDPRGWGAGATPWSQPAVQCKDGTCRTTGPKSSPRLKLKWDCWPWGGQGSQVGLLKVISAHRPWDCVQMSHQWRPSVGFLWSSQQWICSTPPDWLTHTEQRKQSREGKEQGKFYIANKLFINCFQSTSSTLLASSSDSYYLEISLKAPFAYLSGSLYRLLHHLGLPIW